LAFSGEASLWTLKLYPDAGEAGGGRVSVRPTRREGRSCPDRAAAEAARRAKGKIRRYCAANRLNRLGTLTYRGNGCHDPMALPTDVSRFFKSIRGDLDGDAFPYLWVAELHPGGHGLHVHFAVARYIQRSLIEQSWPHGFVHIKLIGDLPLGPGTVEQARIAGRYLGKYAAKSLDEGRVAGLHRYEVAQGFQPASITCYGPTAAEAIETASTYMGASPSQCWFSSVSEGRHGPPACWVAWD
jgi:hypothetical protein